MLGHPILKWLKTLSQSLNHSFKNCVSSKWSLLWVIELFMRFVQKFRIIQAGSKGILWVWVPETCSKIWNHSVIKNKKKEVKF